MSIDDAANQEPTRKMFTRQCRGFKTDMHIYWTETDRPEGAYCPDCKNKWDEEYKAQLGFVQHCAGFLREQHSYITKHYQPGLGNIYCHDCMASWMKMHPPSQTHFKPSEWLDKDKTKGDEAHE